MALEVAEAVGRHNGDLDAVRARLERGQTYRDLSTVILTPTRGGRSLIPKVVGTWFGMIKPMNQKVIGPLFVVGDEVGVAYSTAIESVLTNPDLSRWKYILTLEDDNMPPPDGLMKLYEAIEGGVDGQKYDVVSGLYWTKGEGGQPMCYGRPDAFPLNFIPWLPSIDTVARCNGLGMGFTLFRLELFKNPRLLKPWFKTVQEYIPGQGVRLYTQDLWAFEQMGKLGYRFACDTRVKVGHYDADTDTVW